MSTDICIFLLLAMLIAHIISDYNLQGILADLKQKSFLVDGFNYDKYNMYEYDYISGLVCHSLMWSFITCYPYLFIVKDPNLTVFNIAVLLNAVLHGIVDNYKCNKFKINLNQDQALHLLQIVVTWGIFVLA